MMTPEVAVEADLIATMIVVVAMVAAIEGTAAAVMTTATADRRDMKIETIVHTDVVTTTGLVASIAMPLAAAMIATAAVAMTVVAAEATTVSVAAMVMQHHPGMRMEVEPPTVQTIGTPVVRLRSAKAHRCGSLCEIKAPGPTSTIIAGRRLLAAVP